MNGGPIAIRAAEAVTALGPDAPSAWRRLTAVETGVRPLERDFGPDALTDVAGQLPAEVDDAIERRARETMLPHADCRAFRLAWSVGDRAIRQAPGATALVFGTCKAGMDAFHARLAGRTDPATDLWNPRALAGVLAETLEINGVIRVVEAACTTGLVAVAEAARLLMLGRARRVLVVAVETLDEFLFAGFSSLRAMDRTVCRPFTEDRAGLNLGEAAAAVVLDVQDVNDSALAYILGYGQACDANHLTAPCRESSGLTAAMRHALAMARLSPEAIDVVNAHGTGTSYNDEMEAKALRAVFGTAIPPLLTFKASMGHTMGATGLAEVVLCVEALRTRTVVPAYGHTGWGVSIPLSIPTEPMACEGLRRILTLKSGFGGVNAAAVLAAAEDGS